MRLLRQPALILLLLYLGASQIPAQQEPQQTVAQLAVSISGEIDALGGSAAAQSTNDAAASLLQQINSLGEQSVMIFGPRKQQLDEKLAQLRQTIGDWKLAAVVNRGHAALAAEDMRKLWSEIKSLYPSEALQILPPLWSCPMHQEVMVKSAGSCPVCGMTLEPIYVTQPQLTRSPIIRAELVTKTPLQVGKRVDLRLRLSFVNDGSPVRLSDLEEAHTRKIHLLISDISETDYHHEHPQPVGEGEYAFSFTPSRPDTYRLWADLLPTRTHIQQYSVVDIPSTTPREGKLAPEEPENRHAEIEGFRFDLSFEKSIVHEKETLSGKLRVTQPDGQPCRKLGVVMGALGHFVGFCDDFATVLHIHPVGAQIENAQALGGPELHFYFRSSRTGLVRFFGQVRIDGKDFFPRFVIRVQPLQHLPGL
jgi:Heavy metal binding domain